MMRRGELLGGGHVRDEDKVEGGAREGDAEGAQDQVDEMGNRDQAGHDLEGGQGQHGGRGNPKEHNKIQRRGIKRGLCEGGHEEGGGMAHGEKESLIRRYDQSDQSVSTIEISEDASISRFKWGEGGGQDQGGLVQGGETIHGGEGITSTSFTARKVSAKVSAKIVPMTKNKKGEGGGQDQDGGVQVGGTDPGEGRGLTLDV